MIWFISESNNPENAHSSAEAMIEHVNLILKDTVYLNSEERLNESDEKGMELMEMKRYYKASVNDSEKALGLTIWIVAFVWTVSYKIYINKVNERIELKSTYRIALLLNFLYFIFCFISWSPLFSFNLVHDCPPKKHKNAMGYMDDDGINETELPEKMLNIQKNLIDFYSKQVTPLKEKSIKLKDSRFYVVCSFPFFSSL
uniref:G_PROTEIN_RECEP_F1_2 domain-containing protein n=1 Tax=Caenorhabditis tropicalis TaxID=1561998 RepID=A0A1I7UHT4_9PELO